MQVLSRMEFAVEHLSRPEPILVRDGLAGWPAAGRWSPEHMKSLGRTDVVTLRGSRSGRFRLNPDGSPQDPGDHVELRVPFNEAIDHITCTDPGGMKYYLSQQDISSFAALLADLRLSKPVQSNMVNLWFGSSGAVSPLHFDMNNNLYAQIYGSKVFTIFAPEDTPSLYPFAANSRMFHLSHVDPDAPDLERHPLFANAARMEFTIHAGQLLFLPAFWWHQVRSTSVSISVNHWFEPELTQCGGVNALPLLRRAYRYDKWAGLRRRGGGLSSGQLLDAAAMLVPGSPAAAMLAASVVVDDLETANPGADVFADSALRERWDSMVAAALQSECFEAAPALADIIVTLRAQLRSAGSPHAESVATS